MKNMKFMVIDDSATARKVIVSTLKRMEVEQVIEAENGKDALAEMFRRDIDFIITDWNMPEMNGLEFVKAVKRVEDFKDIPIIMVTSRGMRDDILDAIKAKVNGYIVKPFTVLDLKKKIDETLEK